MIKFLDKDELSNAINHVLKKGGIHIVSYIGAPQCINHFIISVA